MSTDDNWRNDSRGVAPRLTLTKPDFEPARRMVPFEAPAPVEADEHMAFGRYCFAEGVKHATSERDRYRELLEARVSGLEAMLTALHAQVEANVLTEDIDYDLRMKISNYLSGSGPA